MENSRSRAPPDARSQRHDGHDAEHQTFPRIGWLDQGKGCGNHVTVSHLEAGLGFKVLQSRQKVLVLHPRDLCRLLERVELCQDLRR